jgi:NADH-quinone oxidoreductase subunit E
MELAKVDTIIERHGADSTALLAIMQDVQEELRYLPRPAMERVADKLGIPITRVYQMATFFEAFHLEPRGKHICTVCMGTACHVRGAPKLVDQLERDLKVKSGGTTSDMMFTVEEVNCVGACALGPLVIVDGEYHGNMTTNSLSKVITSMKGDVQGGD